MKTSGKKKSKISHNQNSPNKPIITLEKLSEDLEDLSYI